jgi:hypothetical protein
MRSNFVAMKRGPAQPIVVAGATLGSRMLAQMATHQGSPMRRVFPKYI